MIKLLTLASAMLIFSCCTMTAKSPVDHNTSSNNTDIMISPQEVVDNCATPHEVYGFPPQAVPGIPAMLARHAECLGQPNIIVIMWPGENSKVNLLYIEMLVERYVVHLKSENEHYDAKLVAVSSVIVDKESKEPQLTSTYAAVYKLVHSLSIE